MLYCIQTKIRIKLLRTMCQASSWGLCPKESVLSFYPYQASTHHRPQSTSSFQLIEVCGSTFKVLLKSLCLVLACARGKQLPSKKKKITTACGATILGTTLSKNVKNITTACAREGELCQHAHRQVLSMCWQSSMRLKHMLSTWELWVTPTTPILSICLVLACAHCHDRLLEALP